MKQIEVAVATPLHRTFTYLSLAQVEAGCRVLVPFGRRRLVGVALGPATTAAEPGFELKEVAKVIDEQPVYSHTVLTIARWLSSYYMHPLGEVLRTMLPASSTKVVKQAYELTERGAAARLPEHAGTEAEALRLIFGKKRTAISAVTARTRLKAMAPTAPAATKLLKILQKAGFITATRASSARARVTDAAAPASWTDVTNGAPAAARALADGASAANGASAADRTAANGASAADRTAADGASAADRTAAHSATTTTDEPAELVPPSTPEQEQVLRTILTAGLQAPPTGRVYLLHGITGSGKTEVYLKLIAAALADGSGQALVLVPEISLTPQMTRVFARRFPGRVAVVHSALSDPERWTQLDRIRSGEARILIGPRSAVFGPFHDLRLLIVDEEHDHSYKQATGLTYHGRDIAVLRGKLEHATVVLGSATPSLESYHNALTGRYTLLEMMSRVGGRPLPSIEVLTLAPAPRQGTLITNTGGHPGAATLAATDGAIPMAPQVLQALADNMAAKHQAIVLVNRRGYAYYLLSVDEKKAVQCVSCSISMTLHARSTVLRCHYCDYSIPVAKVLQERPNERFIAIGYGSQKAEDGLRAQLPDATIVRLDSDAVTQQDLLPKTLARFRRGDIDILVGTQILAKGHDFPNVTLIVILEVDQLLGLPDFRAGERTFQLIVQAAGRAGRAEHAGRVLLQSLRSSHPVVEAAVAQDYAAFVTRELDFRRQHGYPPFARMIAVEFNSTDPARLDELSRRINGWIEHMAQLQPERVRKVRLLGPAAPPIEKVRSRHRRQLIFTSEHTEALRGLVQQFVAAFHKLPGDLRLRIDVDPQSLI